MANQFSELDRERWETNAAKWWNDSVKQALILLGNHDDDHVSYPEVNAVVYHAMEELMNESIGAIVTGNADDSELGADLLQRMFAQVFFTGYEAGKAGAVFERYAGICEHSKGANN